MDDSLFELRNTGSFLLTGCPKLDNFLRGGICRKGITQIYGKSGIGKTQLALQLCITAQISSDNFNDFGGAAYICTESPFPSNRLHELINKINLKTKYPISNEMIFIEHISNSEDLKNCIYNPRRLPNLLSHYNIKLLVIDSIAATFRVEYDSVYLQNRAKSLRNIGYRLQKLSSIYNMAIICINQVTALVETSSINVSTTELPSLGITWASMITNSLYMFRQNGHRFLHITGSPYLPCQTIEYEILDSGIIVKNT
ncbi:PREDICTED: DNA repair protein XRCC3-like [Ceratosolen solmsi marchali]|uniref:DNA repair protein XRCC3-like n=1 Tax=Ceratosolen solmsi marchali TaxID=326594 RepID=A0AAJ7E0Y3_9HYME|nr:PREDICTED: DNA repair protein XRCC3-like [Ceratosolen solmsi marchali]XP_011503638.1 PREDICTED: DNA repair protein XRCC3-like [Ceratosolen solmsi marchali]XP_011503639.1 PREDICTED: DNA repair protein XRCC3-like [Ceratosolen solmsi marchali]